MPIIKRAKNITINVKNVHNIFVGGKYEIIAEKIQMTATQGNLSLNSYKKIELIGRDGGIELGNYNPPEKKIVESQEYKLKSTYIHDHLTALAQKMIPVLDNNNTSIIHQFYKKIAQGEIPNPEIIVSKEAVLGKIIAYDEKRNKIIV